jgi:hypothetical protein
MRVFFSISLALLVLVSDTAMAQTATPAPPAMSKAALRHQDRAECNKEAARLQVPRSSKAGFLRQCMADRQGERKIRAK